MNGRTESILTGIGTIALAFSALFRALVTIDPMPVWSMDPLIMWIPPSGIGPTALIALDLAGILGAAAIILARRRSVGITPAVLLLVGCAGVAVHAARLPADAEVGLPWVFAMSAAFALAHLPRGSIWRTVALASMLAAVVLLVGKGVLQIFVEHPHTIASYEHTRDAFLRSQGWTPDSAMARNYERRLYQPEASGWFGLSNVYASIMAASALGLGTLGVLTLRHKPSDRRVPWLMLAASALCVFALVLSRSKGGVGAGLLGLVAIVTACRYHGRARVVIGAVPVVVLLGIVARGLVGERVGELSILFRWFYMEGATRVFLDHPLVGVGPAGFKDAYLLAKPAISPEEVTSAHNLLFDWLATLGLFSLGWIALFALACRRVGDAIDARAHDAPPDWDERSGILIAAGLFAGTIAAAAFAQRALLTPEMGIVRAAGLLGGLVLAAAVVRASRRHPGAVTVGLAGIAAVLFGHLQIEVVGVWASSAPLAACLVGLALAPPDGPRRRGGGGFLATGGLVAVVFLVAATAGRTIWRWESALGRATDAVEPFASAISDLRTAEAGTPEFMEAADDIAAYIGHPTAGSDAELGDQIGLGRARALREALPGLLGAVEARPGHLQTRQQGVLMLLYAALETPGPDASREQGIALARAGVEADPSRSGAWRLLANTLRSAAGGEPGGRARLEEAYRSLSRAIKLDPHGLALALDLSDLAGRLGLPDEARAWARRALEINADLRLDPLRQLTETERAAVERRAAGG